MPCYAWVAPAAAGSRCKPRRTCCPRRSAANDCLRLPQRFPIPEHVWSPAGGWWADPPNWESNTRWAFAGMMSIAAGLFYVSSQVEVRLAPLAPFAAGTLRWQFWA